MGHCYNSSVIVRPSWDRYFLDIAQAVAQRASCPRLSVGCVLVNEGNRIVGTGYNGSMPGAKHCSDDGCLVVGNSCQRTTHAEENAIRHSAGVLYSAYTTHAPCIHCAAMLEDAGVLTVLYSNDYKTPDYGAAGIRMLIARYVP